MDDLGNCFAEAIQITRRGGGLEKVAGTLHPEVSAYLRNLQSDPKYQYVLMTPMGSFEYWGMNQNGDLFPDLSLSFNREKDNPLPYIEALEKKWLLPHGRKAPPGNYTNFGHKTFLEALRYRHHANKNPEIAYGDITLSVWNPAMHRSEVISRHDREKAKRVGAEEIISDLDAGKPRQISMGCFLDGSLVTMADGTRKAIEEIQVGDLVLTHKGRARKVTETHRRPYQGMVYAIRAEAHEMVYATHEHPFWAVPESQVKNDHRVPRWLENPTLDPSWVCAEHVVEGHYLLEPVLEEVLTPDYATSSFCRLLGYYLAEGHILRNKKKEISGVEFTTNVNDAIHLEIEKLCEEFGTRNPAVTTQRENSESSLKIQIFDDRLASLLFEHGGSYSRGKKLSAEAMRWDPDLQREILGAYGNGDGCGLPNGALTLSTASTNLAWQWVALLPRLGIIPSIQNLEHKAGTGFSTRATYEWVIHIGKMFAQKLQDVCAKVVTSPVEKVKSARKIFDGYVVTPIREYEASYMEVEVNNLEVEEDNSYLVAGMAVHNCKVPFDVCTICGAISKTPNDYCDHLRTMMGSILPDGAIVGAVNLFPKFFDLSDVFVPAARESGVIMKVAQFGGLRLRATDKVATQRKSADITKQIIPNPSRMALEKAIACEPDLPRAALNVGSFGSLLSSLAAAGIILKPREFQDGLLSRMGEKGLADELWNSRQTFRPLPFSGLPQTLDTPSPGIMRLMTPFLSERSGFCPYLPERVMRVMVVIMPTPTAPKVAPDSPVLQKVAHVYGAYRAALRNLPSFLSIAMERDSEYYETNFFRELLTDSMEKSSSHYPTMNLSTSLVPLYAYNAHQGGVVIPPPSWNFDVPSNSPARALLSPVL